LLAEDNEVNQKVAVRLLRKLGHVVTVVGDGILALEALKDHSFDLIFMDVQMPRMGGFEATHAIRERERTQGRHTPIIALTAHAMKGDLDRCLSEGMDGYLSKPIRVPDLLEKLERISVEPLSACASETEPSPA
jgi:CheY-like chemotaxis protein